MTEQLLNGAIEAIDFALRAEAKARAAAIAIGEQIKVMREERRHLSNEELCLHAHLVGEWQRASRLVTEVLEEIAPGKRAEKHVGLLSHGQSGDYLVTIGDQAN